jgi:hypothetical protein
MLLIGWLVDDPTCQQCHDGSRHVGHRVNPRPDQREGMAPYSKTDIQKRKYAVTEDADPGSPGYDL